MRRTGLATLLAVLWIGLVVAPSADAQRRQQQRQQAAEDQPSAEDRTAAREAYARGQEEFRAGNFEAAAAAFGEAYQAVPNPVVLLGVAEARERMGDVPGAIQALEQYLEERPDAPDAEEIQARLATLRTVPAVLVVTSDPPGAAITLDGQPRDQVTPAEIEVQPGEHVVAVTLAEHEPASETVQAEHGGRHEIQLDLVTAAEGLDEDPFGDEGGGAAAPPPLDEDATDDGALPAGVWVAAGISGAALVGGTVLGFLALSEQSDYDMMPTESSADRGERLALFADVVFGVAIIAGVTAIVLYLTSDTEAADDTPDVAVAPTVSPTGGGLSAQVQF